MSLRYEVGVAAPLPAGLAAEIERRFGPVGTVITGSRRVALHGLVTDQSALRGLLALLWDLNIDLIGLHVHVVPPGRRGGPDDAPN
jgi:hypothetical protein